MSTDWLDYLGQERSSDCVLISVVKTRGSCPRDVGTRMIVDSQCCLGTIGGGHLEYLAIGTAREWLHSPHPRGVHVERYPLGPRLGQCCGGVVHLSFERIGPQPPAWVAVLQRHQQSGEAAIMVSPLAEAVTSLEDKLIVALSDDLEPSIESAQDPSLASLHLPLVTARASARRMLLTGNTTPSQRDTGFLYERFTPPHFPVWIFGAGHVGSALVNVLAPLPCQITWVDSRAEAFPEQCSSNVQHLISDDPVAEIPDMAPGTHALIMTHDHSLDEALCAHILQRNDPGWCGLIGSESKARRFNSRLRSRGLSHDQCSRLVCPIGVAGITGKQPAQIAIAVAAELLQYEEASQGTAFIPKATAVPG